jgi:hypothetical protein
MAKSKVDWDAIAREYIEARSDNVRPKLIDLSNKYGVSFAAIQKKCQRDQWVEKSRMFVRRLGQEIRDNQAVVLADSLASSQVEFDSECLNVARKLIKQVNRVLVLTEEKQSDEPEQGIRPSDLTHYSNTLLSAQKVGRIALGSDSLTPDKIVNEALKLGFIVVDPRTDTSDTGADGQGKSEPASKNPFDNFLSESASELPDTEASESLS